MKINSTETVRLNTSRLSVEDSGKSKYLALKIDSAHAGIVNGNYLFYTPRALREGVESIKEFYKPLQRKHYSQTLGYVYDAEFESKAKSSKYLEAIEKAKSKEELGKLAKEYYYSSDYKENEDGFGVLVSKAKLYNKDKIISLVHKNDKGHVSIAGDAFDPICSICYGDVTVCKHDLGSRYNNEMCFAIVDHFEVDHVSFEDIPANWKTNTLIVADSLVNGSVDLIDEGQTMKLNLEDFKVALGNIENLLTELDLTQYTEQYKQEAEQALGGDFLFPKEKLLHLNTKLGVLVATKLQERLEDGTEKDTVGTLINKEYTKIFQEKTVEEALEDLGTASVTEEAKEVVESVDESTDPVKEEDTSEGEQEDTETDPVKEEGNTLQITDGDRVVLAVVDSLSQLVDTKLASFQEQIQALLTQEQTSVQNTLYTDRIEALQQDLVLAKGVEDTLVEDLRTSLLGQIALLKQVDVQSDYYTKLASRSVKELKLTLEDHLAMQQIPVKVEPTTLAVEDAQKDIMAKTVDTVGVEDALSTMAETKDVSTLAVEDADQIVSGIMASIGDRNLEPKEYATLYKQTAADHGIAAAKKLHVVLKQQYKI